MGFLSRLFSNSQAVSTPVKVEISVSQSSYYVETKQKTRGVLPAISSKALDGYVSPSGGFVSYGRFQVIGTNPDTKRKNKRIYEVKDSGCACKYAERDGLIGPFDITVLPSVPPSDRQLAYAKSLGARIPSGACFLDVSAIISRITENEEKLDSENIAKLAFAYGVKFSRYHSKSAIMNIAKNTLSVIEYSNFMMDLC